MHDQEMNKDVRLRMNALGRKNTPFLFLFDFEMKKPEVHRLDELPDHIDLVFSRYSTIGPVDPVPGRKFLFQRYPMPLEEYARGFDMVQKGLHRGDSFLLNLSYPTPVLTDLSMQEIFNFSQSKYKIRYGNDWVSFSPETFVKINNGYIYSFPMKGTIDASLPGAANSILANRKETAEHNTIVDLIRNDLSRVSRQVKVTRYRYIDRIFTHEKEMLQVSSEIRGQLPDDYRSRIGDIVVSLLPAGSISGAPKKKTLEIIRSAEGRERGFYTGIAGVFDGNNVDSCVLIRFIEQQNGQKYYRSGGGITYMSTLDAEYQEMIDKVYVPIYRNHTDRQREGDEHPVPQSAL